VVLLVHHDDAIGIHEVVRDEAHHRRRNRDAVEVEPAGRFNEMKQPVLLLDEARDDSYGDVAGRGVKGRPSLDLPSRVGAQGLSDGSADWGVSAGLALRF
jgi:hypothetical protein